MASQNVRLGNRSYLGNNGASILWYIFANLESNALKDEVFCAMHSQSYQNVDIIVSLDLCAWDDQHRSIGFMKRWLEL